MIDLQSLLYLRRYSTFLFDWVSDDYEAWWWWWFGWWWWEEEVRNPSALVARILGKGWQIEKFVVSLNGRDDHMSWCIDQRFFNFVITSPTFMQRFCSVFQFFCPRRRLFFLFFFSISLSLLFPLKLSHSFPPLLLLLLLLRSSPFHPHYPFSRKHLFGPINGIFLLRLLNIKSRDTGWI